MNIILNEKKDKYLLAKSQIENLDYSSEIAEKVKEYEKSLIEQCEFDRQNKLAKINICLELLDELIEEETLIDECQNENLEEENQEVQENENNNEEE